MNDLMIWEKLGVPAIFFGGVFFHFLYKYFGKKPWMAIISPVNESIWEHLKIAFYPTFCYTLFELIVLKEVPANFLTGELVGIYAMFIFILVAEWIYPAILKRNILILDFIVFILGIGLSQLVSYHVMTEWTGFVIPYSFAGIIIFAQVFIFGVFSFNPPKAELFRDSVTGKYGIEGQR